MAIPSERHPLVQRSVYSSEQREDNLSPSTQGRKTNRPSSSTFWSNLTPRQLKFLFLFGVSGLIYHIYRLTSSPGDISHDDRPSSESSSSFEIGPLGGKYAICSSGSGSGTIYTVENKDGSGETECVVVDGDVVIDTGSLIYVQDTYGKKHDIEFFGQSASLSAKFRRHGSSSSKRSFKIINLPPHAVLTPGLVDSHAHTLLYGHVQRLPLVGASSIQSVIHRLEEYVVANQEKVDAGEWIEGMGWDQNIWPTKKSTDGRQRHEFPTASDFEASTLLRGKAIALKRIDVHAEWVSPKVLQMMGPLPDSVEGGQILRDENGKPTGVFLDDAMELIDAIRPQWSESQMRSYLSTAIRDGTSRGLTGIHDAGVEPLHVDFFLNLASTEPSALPIRFYLMRACPEKEVYCGDDYPMVKRATGGTLDVRSVKLFGDGALGSWGAAMLEPYSDRKEDVGTMRIPEHVWEPLIDEYVRNGWQVNVHCIGDRCNRIVVDAMEKALTKYKLNGTETRLRLEHAQIMTIPDLERAAKMGVIASYQPTHATSDMWYAEDRIGPERMKGAYAWRSYLNAGGRITLGSDFPVESIDPLQGFYAAIARADASGKSPHGNGPWFPEEVLTRYEALRGMTKDAAFASFSEKTSGSFEKGMKFDAVVWDRDLMTVPPREVLGSKVLATIVDGKVVYQVGPEEST